MNKRIHLLLTVTVIISLHLQNCRPLLFRFQNSVSHICIVLVLVFSSLCIVSHIILNMLHVIYSCVLILYIYISHHIPQSIRDMQTSISYIQIYIVTHSHPRGCCRPTYLQPDKFHKPFHPGFLFVFFCGWQGCQPWLKTILGRADAVSKCLGVLPPNAQQGFPFHSSGLGVEGVFARRCATVRNRSQPSA